MNIDVKAAIRRADDMKSARSTWEAHWQEIRDLAWAAGMPFTSTEVPGQKSRSQILDGTSEMAGELLASALQGMLTNPANKWFALRLEDDRLMQRADVAIWLQHATDTMLRVFASPRSGFTPNQHEKYLSLVNYGTAGMFIADRPGVGPVFQTRSLDELFMDEGPDGTIDRVYRRWTMTARAAIGQFGDAAGPKVVERAKMDRPSDDKVEFLHCVEARPDADPSRPGSRNMAIASYYINVTDKHLVSERGFEEWPWVTPRWGRRPGEIYGRGPGARALGDGKMLQRVMKATIRAAEKAVNPPLQVADDGVMSPVRLNSGGITHVRADMMRFPGGGIRPIESAARPDIGEDFCQQIRERIATAYHNNLLQQFKDPRMTATQSIQIAEETLRILGPVLGRLQVEDLGPMIDRVFPILYRRGAFLPVPEVLGREGADLAVEYMGPLAKAQKLSDARGVTQTLEVMSPMITAQPEILDNIDGDLTFRRIASVFDWPLDTLRGSDRVLEVRTARNEAGAAEQERQATVEGAEVAAKLVPAIANARGAPAAAA